LESLQCGVDGAKCHVTPSFLFDLPRYRYAIRAIAEPNDCEHDQQLKFTEIICSGHFFDYNEELSGGEAAAFIDPLRVVRRACTGCNLER